MKKYGMLLFLISAYVFGESLPKNTVLPSRDVLLDQFQTMNIVKKSEWKKGKIQDGQPTLHVRFGGDLYLINNSSVASMSLTEGKDGMREAHHAASTCFNIAYAVTKKRNNDIKRAVTDIIEEAANHESGSSGDLVDGYWFTVDIKKIDRFPMLVCAAKGFTRWD